MMQAYGSNDREENFYNTKILKLANKRKAVKFKPS